MSFWLDFLAMVEVTFSLFWRWVMVTIRFISSLFEQGCGLKGLLGAVGEAVQDLLLFYILQFSNYYL